MHHNQKYNLEALKIQKGPIWNVLWTRKGNLQIILSVYTLDIIPSRASFSYDQAFILVPLELLPFALAEVEPFILQKNCFIPKCSERCACKGKNTWVKENFHNFMISIRKDTKMLASTNLMHWKTLPTSISVRNTDMFGTMKFFNGHLYRFFQKNRH